MIERLSIFPGAVLLDIACGRGASLLPASQKVGQQGNVVGIDFSENMISETRKVIVENRYSNVQVKQMDAENLLFKDNYFDFISCGFSIFFFSDHRLALREMLRVLKPEGKIGITTWEKRKKPSIAVRVAEKYLDANEVITVSKTEFGISETLELMFIETGFNNIKIKKEYKRFYYKDEE